MLFGRVATTLSPAGGATKMPLLRKLAKDGGIAITGTVTPGFDTICSTIPLSGRDESRIIIYCYCNILR